jgi:DMSO/TMAO reductase YedYZ molybdopterin-dependent catalytic subunit
MPTRRRFLGRAGAAALFASCAPATGDKAGDEAGEETGEPGSVEPVEPITPNDDFYSVAIGGSPEEGWDAAWTLLVTSADGDEAELDLDALKALGEETVERTLSCIGDSSGWAIGNATWTGVRVTTLLEALGFARAGWVRADSYDGFWSTLPDSDEGMMLVWGMNGVDLPLGHGGPVRVLTTNRYGMKQPKWVIGVRVTAADETGYWEEKGWSNEATFQVISAFRYPSDGDEVAMGTIDVTGVAFAGSSPVVKLELSDDDGETWFEAAFTYEGKENVWACWRASWTPAAPGAYTLLARATAADGRVQADDEHYDENYDGLRALARLYVTVT